MIGESNFLTISYSLLMNLNQVKIINDNIIIQIPEYFIDQVSLVSLQWHEVRIISDTGNRNIKNEELILEYTYLINFYRKLRCEFNSYITYQGITKNIIKFNNEDYSKITINCDKNIKGFFIEYDIDEIERFGVQVENHDLFDPYNNTHLQLLSTTISDKMFYVPLNSKHKYDDNTIESYQGGINGEKVKFIEVLIRLNKKKTDEIKIYTLELGAYLVHDGIAAPIKFSQVSYNEDALVNFDYTRKKYKQRKLPIGWRIEYIFDRNSKEIYIKCNKCNEKLNYYENINKVVKNDNCPLCNKEWINKVAYENRG